MKKYFCDLCLKENRDRIAVGRLYVKMIRYGYRAGKYKTLKNIVIPLDLCEEHERQLIDKLTEKIQKIDDDLKE